MKRYRYTIQGSVQGVGFRPFIFRVANALGLTGIVKNTSSGVYLEVQGEEHILEELRNTMIHQLPLPIEITALSVQEVDYLPEEIGFFIEESYKEEGYSVRIHPDMSTCIACVNDLKESTNRRYRYPFTNCTACGPRYTIIKDVPYDRKNTTMDCFPMCSRCLLEYNDPMNRRFHAQPNACPVCGPQLWLTDTTGTPIAEGYQAIQKIVESIYQGKIVAIKGLGGFHLVCDATNSHAIAELRRRKHRPHKSLAIMVPNIEVAHELVYLSEPEVLALRSSQCPIVVAPCIPDRLPKNIAPDVSSLGIMLCYTPLHHILFDEIIKIKKGKIPALIMTSGNMSGEPIVIDNREALVKLGGIADVFLLHNRDILVRTDDSVIQIDTFERQYSQHTFRRARGYVPLPVTIPSLDIQGPCVLALGAELKNTICFTRGQDAFLSQYIGDLKTPETETFFRQLVVHFKKILGVTPECIVCDLHPDYLSSVYASESSLPVMPLQHHFAHGYSVLAEHGYTKPALVLALDGTGYGSDGTLWGGELLCIHPNASKKKMLGEDIRIGRLAPFPLPGGEVAIREPWRLVSGFLALPEFKEYRSAVEERWESKSSWLTIHQAIYEMLHKGNVIETSSCGRFFDAVSALLGLCEYITYEGQAAILLEEHQGVCCSDRIFTSSIDTCNGLYQLDTKAFFLQLIALQQQNVPTDILSRMFHVSLCEGLADLALAGAKHTGVYTIAMSGGVFNNKTIRSLLPKVLYDRGLEPLMHINIPSGDDGISLGQAYWARMVLD